MWKYIAGTIAFGSITYGLKKYFAGGVCKCTARLDGLVVIITGANSGLGKALAFELAKRGAILVLACRNVEKAVSVKNEILQALGTDIKVHIKHLDLNSFDSILKFAETISSQFEEVYALVNNAGVFYHPQVLTKDGFDVTLQTNYLGPFILTHHILKVLKKTDHARIVNVSSDAHRLVNAYDLNCVTTSQTEFRTHYIAYGVSKLALLLFTREFSKKIANTNIIVNAVDPGNVETSIYRYFPQLSNPWLYILQWPIRQIVIKRPNEGAQSILHALLTSNRSTGQYIKDCKPVLPSTVAANDKIRLLTTMDLWISSDKKIKKVILAKGTGTSKPTENCMCNVLFTNTSATFKFDNDVICIGDSDGQYGQLLDIVLQMMHEKEKAQVTFNTTDVIEFTVELLSFTSHGLIYEWNAKYKYDLAFLHKEKGIKWFQTEEFEKASHRFSKGLKLLLSIPIDVEDIPQEIDSIKLADINGLVINLYNNLASCYLKVRNYNKVIQLCGLVLSHQKDVKAFYKMGIAHFEMNDFESAQDALKNVLELDPGNKAAIGKIKIVKKKLDEGNTKYVEIVKRMFP